MNILALIKQNLSTSLCEQLAGAAGAPLAAVEQYAQAVLPALVAELARPIGLSDLNARWDMCRQLYLSQLLTDPAEWLRTDMGWPARRHYLAHSIAGEPCFAALTEGRGVPPQAPALLGYLTILTLATIGQHASQADLGPADLGTWLAGQQVPASAAAAAPVSAPAPVAAPPAQSSVATVSRPALAKPSAPAQPVSVQPVAPVVVVPVLAAAPAKKPNTTMLSLIGVAVVAVLAGGYFLLGTPANAEQQAPATTTEAAGGPVAPVAAPAPVAKAPALAPAVASAAGAKPTPAAPAKAAPVVASKPAPGAPARASATPAHATGEVLIDTIGNAAQASHIGGSFSAALGRYPKGEGQPLDIKLANHATISVGINSSESLLYKRLVNNSLSRPSSIPLDRLVFDPNQAKLGAEGAQQLGSIANLLKTFPKARLLILGHATTKETEAMRLSLARANAVIDELVKQGIYAQRLQAQGVLATGPPAGSTAAEKLAMQQGISLSVSRL